jgi:RND family efflux transporter MFP subunit
MRRLLSIERNGPPPAIASSAWPWRAQGPLLLLAVLLGGCNHEPAEAKHSAGGSPTVQVVRPTVRTIDNLVEQPGFITAYERTSIFSKVSGFIKAFYVDIGSEVKKGELLAEIFVPELNEEYQQKTAQVALDQQMVVQAQQLVVVAESNVQNAIAQVDEAQAQVGKYDAQVVLWESNVGRLTQLARDKSIDQKVLDESQRQLDANRAARTAARATVAARAADRATAEANLGKSKIDVATAKAKVKVSEADARKAAALLAYTKVTAPYDGRVTVRNANTGDYVQAATGDKSTANPAAIFVVERVDMLRIFMDVPEGYARYVQVGSKATIRADALSGIQIPGTVARSSWAIRERTRTLWTEIDLSKAEYGGLRPGMYVYSSILIQRPNVHALPQRALMVSGNQTYCFLLRGGKAVKTSVDVGLSDDAWVEVDRLKIYGSWVKVTGDEQVILADLSELTDGDTVEVVPTPGPAPAPGPASS